MDQLKTFQNSNVTLRRQPNWLKQTPSTFVEVIESPEPNFQRLSKEYYNDAIGVIAGKTTIFLNINSTGDNNAEIAYQFAGDLLSTRPDWKIEEIDFFFKFIRTRQDIPELKLFGNKITGLKLMEFVSVYEDYRSQEREEYLRKKHKTEPRQIESAKADPSTIKAHIEAIGELLKPQKKEYFKSTNKEENNIDSKLIASIDNDSINKRIQKIMIDFDELAKEIEQDKNEKRVVFVNGIMMNTEQYLQYRLGIEL